MHEKQKTLYDGYRPEQGEVWATCTLPDNCRPAVAQSEATPPLQQAHGKTEIVAPFALVARRRRQTVDDFFAAVARVIGREPTEPDAHVSDWYDWEERAAIMEYDGGLSRADAERSASELLRRRNIGAGETEET